MTQLAVAVEEQADGDRDEAEVVGGLLLPADEQAAEAVEPGVRDLHDPVPRRIAVGGTRRRQRVRGAGFGRDRHDVAAFRGAG